MAIFDIERILLDYIKHSYYKEKHSLIYSFLKVVFGYMAMAEIEIFVL